MRQQSSPSSTTWTYYSSLLTAGSSALQGLAWGSPQTHLLWTIVGTSHPRGFCLQGFPPCCTDTLHPASIAGLLISSTHGNITTSQAFKSATDVLESILQRTRCVQPGLGGLPEEQGNSQVLTSVLQSQQHRKELCSKPSRELILRSHSLHSQVLIYNSFNNYRKPQRLFCES